MRTREGLGIEATRHKTDRPKEVRDWDPQGSAQRAGSGSLEKDSVLRKAGGESEVPEGGGELGQILSKKGPW